MNLNNKLAELLGIGSDLIFPIEISVGIFLVSVILYTQWSLKINKARNELIKLIRVIRKSPLKGVGALNELLSETDNQQIRSLIYETRDNLIEIEGDLGPEFYSLRSYSDLWTSRGVLAGRLNLSLFETMPNILIGAGLMFTFIFLALALADAGMAMDSKDIAVRNDSMKSLIANAGGKFISSIIGLFCSLAWNLGAKEKIDKLQSAVMELHSALKQIAPDSAAQAIVRRQHSIFKEMLAESREQVGQLKRFETDIALAIAKAISGELQPSFKLLSAELVEAIQNLTNRIGNMNEDALQTMIAQFIEEFRGTSSDEMKEFKNVLTQLAENLKNVGAKFGEDVSGAGATFGSAAERLENAIVKTQETVTQLDSSLQRAGDVVSNGSDRFELVSDKLLNNLQVVQNILGNVDEFIDKIQKNIGMLNNISDTLDDTIDAQKLITIEFRDAVPKMSKALADAVAEISQSSQVAADSLSSIRLELENTKESLDGTVVSISTGVDQYTDKVKDLHIILDEKIGEAISKIGSAVMDLTDTLDELVESLPKK
jgi:hypothetical protein